MGIDSERRYMMNLKTTFDGLTFENPLMPASGPLVGDSRKLLFLQSEGVGGLVTKTISTKEPHIPKPCIYGGNGYVMNSELWSEYPKEKWIEAFLPELMVKKDRPIIVSVGYTKEDMEELIPLLNPFADAFEVSTHYVGKDLEVIRHTVETIKKYTSKPVYMKVSPHIPNPEAFAKVCKEAGASGIVAINSLGPTLKLDLANRSIMYGNDAGFVWTSGPAIKNVALAIVYKIRKALPDFTIIGVGGIQSAEDVLEFLLAGANAVQMLSGALLKGKDLYHKIIQDLPEALKKYGFHSVEEVIQTELINPVKYEGRPPFLLEEKCIKCRLCEKICPYFAISFDERIRIDETLCFNCGLCVSKCPTKALT